MTDTIQIFLKHFDLILVGVVSFSIGILGFIVFLNNRKSVTNEIFLLLSLISISYSIVNYMSYQSVDRDFVLWLLRLVIFSATWYSFCLFSFFYVFPREISEFPIWYKYGVTPIVFIVSILTLTPLVFSGIKGPSSIPGETSEASLGPLVSLFGITAISLVFASIFLLFKKTRESVGLEKKQFQLILIGTFTTYILIIIFNLIFPIVLKDVGFIKFTPIFLFPSVAFISYAIIKHGLFDIKIIATELLVFVIWIIVFVEILTKTSWEERIIESVIFLFVVVFGIFLIRSVRKEVSQREKFELLSKELGVANAKLQELDQMKTDFISIASHQLRTPLTAIKGYSSMILEGTYGDTSLKIKGAVDKIFQYAQRLIYIVNDLLDVSRIEQGRFQLALEEVKIANVLKDVVEELRTNAQKKNLDLSFNVSIDDAEVKIKADPSKIRQVLTNLVDNAIKYTPSGYVKAELQRVGATVLISVKDSGAGISPETLSNLFQKFTRAKNVAKLHTDGSGLGLYIAKQIIDAHQGKIWAESTGEGHGSRFCVELPIGN